MKAPRRLYSARGHLQRGSARPLLSSAILTIARLKTSLSRTIVRDNENDGGLGTPFGVSNTCARVLDYMLHRDLLLAGLMPTIVAQAVAIFVPCQ